MNQNTTPVVATETETPVVVAVQPSKPARKGPARAGKKVVVVEVKAPVVEAEAVVAEVKAAPEAPKVEVKAEAPVVTLFTCKVTGEKRTADRMVVLKIGDLERKLKRWPLTLKDLEDNCMTPVGAMQSNLKVDDTNRLDVAIEIVRHDNEKAAKAKEIEDARIAKAEKLRTFRASVFIGQPKMGADGKLYLRCVQGRDCEHAKLKGTAFVGSEDIMQAPSLEVMQEMNWDNRRGRMVTVDQLANFYVLCPGCAQKLIENPQPQSAKSAQQEIEKDLEQNGADYEAEAERVAEAEARTAAANVYYPKTQRGKRGDERRGDKSRRPDRANLADEFAED